MGKDKGKGKSADKKSVLLNISQELHDRVETMAGIMEIDVSSFIRLAIREKLEREEAKEKRDG